MQPVYNLIEQLFVRLEEFQVLLEVAKRNQTSSENISLLLDCRTEFDKLCDRIDKVEELMAHIQNNLEKLEEDVVKNEVDLGFGEASIIVSSIFSPLFVINLCFLNYSFLKYKCFYRKRMIRRQKQVPFQSP